METQSENIREKYDFWVGLEAGAWQVLETMGRSWAPVGGRCFLRGRSNRTPMFRRVLGAPPQH